LKVDAGAIATRLPGGAADAVGVRQPTATTNAAGIRLAGRTTEAAGTVARLTRVVVADRACTAI
jgi:hypothetical protein